MNLTEIDLIAGEEIVTELNEIIFRQIISIWLGENGIPSSEAFGYSSADKMKPSYSRASKVSAQESRNWRFQYGHSKSVAVFGLSVGEASEAPLRVIDDSNVKVPTAKAPGHCYIDFRATTKQQSRDIRARLLMHALDRGMISTIDPEEDLALFED